MNSYRYLQFSKMLSVCANISEENNDLWPISTLLEKWPVWVDINDIRERIVRLWFNYAESADGNHILYGRMTQEEVEQVYDVLHSVYLDHVV